MLKLGKNFIKDLLPKWNEKQISHWLAEIDCKDVKIDDLTGQALKDLID